MAVWSGLGDDSMEIDATQARKWLRNWQERRG